ncbi:hypothetical protein [Lutispora sp.]|uniref:hypothetical protein n=1 Tax=Lutispora sp. TaxID=2828727 RepID=UPI003563DE5E
MKKRIIIMVIVMSLILIMGCSENYNEQEEQYYSNNVKNMDDNMKSSEGYETVEEDSKIYYGEWKISRLLPSEAPSIWGKEDVEGFIGKSLILTPERAVFDSVELYNPQYGERVVMPNELWTELVTTYEALGLDSKNPPLLVTIYTDDSMDEESEWISDSIIYGFFVKDSNTLISENRNTYFELLRVN